MGRLRVDFVLLIFYWMYEIIGGVDWPFPQQDNHLDNSTWKGRWFPQPPDKLVDDNPVVEYRNSDTHEGVVMGVPSILCDNAEMNLTMDWDGSPVNYTCFEDKAAYLPDINIHPLAHTDFIPSRYRGVHLCMDQKIMYEDQLPTYGPHRPLWAKWGEYMFVPIQRWLHNVEHGGVVMLYNPCANYNEVAVLKHIVKNCLYKHIITPYDLSPERPLALVTYGNRLEFSKVDLGLVIKFIRLTALRGAEDIANDGQYDLGLIEHAKIISDLQDHKLCPNF